MGTVNAVDEKTILECCNCLQTAMYSICENCGIDPIFVLINGFSIEYGKKKGTDIWEILRLNTPLGFEEYYLNTCGLEFKEVNEKLENPTDLDFTSSEAVLIWEDAFYCPWNEAYKKTHVSHFCIAENYDSSAEALICNDPYLEKVNEVFPLSILFESPYRVFEIRKSNIENCLSVESALKNLFSVITEEGIRGNYSRLIKDIYRAKEKKDLFENGNPQNCNLNIFTKQISDCYKGLAYLFSDEKKVIDNPEIYDLLINAKNIWKKINFVLIRMNIKSKEELNGCESLIEILSEAEKIDLMIIKKIKLKWG